MSPVLRLTPILAMLLLAACQKQPEATTASPKAAAPKQTVDVVKENERSKNFTAVNRHLELGGTLYGYVDVEGDVAKLMEGLQQILGEVAKSEPNARMFAQQNLPEIATMLGLTDVKALGVSSVPDGTGFYRNRMFLYTGGERRGLMNALGGKPAPFKHVGLAPADTALYGESEMDFAVVYKTLKDVVAKVAGEPVGNQLEEALKKAGESATISFLDLIYGLKGRTAMILRVDPEKTYRLPGREALVVPAFSFLAVVEGVGQVVEPSLAQVPLLRKSEVGATRVYEFAQKLPFEGLQPAIVIDGTTLYVTSSVDFLKQCREQKTGLAQTPEFAAALEKAGKEGNGLAYVSPKVFQALKRFETLNDHLPPQVTSTIKFALAQVPASDRPLVSVRTNLEDGILIRSYYNRSLKQEIAAVSIYNPVTVGLMAAMAIPAFQKVRMASQEKAVLNNLRMLSAAADQHYLETGTRTATYDDLVGPTKYVKQVESVAGENYRRLRFAQGEPLAVQLSDGRTIQYPPGPMQGRPTPQRGPGKTKKQ